MEQLRQLQADGIQASTTTNLITLNSDKGWTGLHHHPAMGNHVQYRLHRVFQLNLIKNKAETCYKMPHNNRFANPEDPALHSPAIAPDNSPFWSNIAAQFQVCPDFINLENGYFGVQAQSVFEAFLKHQTRVNRETSFFLRQHYPALLAQVMQALADFCEVGVDELVLTRNLVESMNILLQGYPFVAGDEVLLAAHDYDSVVETLEMVAQRKQLTLTRIAMPSAPEIDAMSDAQIVGLYEERIGPRTRAILVTHMLHRNGHIMPVAQIAAMARRHGVDVLVDAAHSFAQLDYRLPDLGADFVAVNLHKWLGAPLGVALLYIRRQRVADIAPLYGDITHAAQDINRLAHFGTIPPAPVLTILDALAFHRQIGSANKEARLRYLTQYWMARVRDVSGLRLMTPSNPARSCAIAAFTLAGMDAYSVVERLMQQHRIFTVTRELNGHMVVRITPHLYTTTQELDLLVAALQEMA